MTIHTRTLLETNTITMKQEFTLEIHSDNNFSVLNRIVNILNRRRIRIKKLVAHGLLEPVGASRFQMHELLVKHAKSLLQ